MPPEAFIHCQQPHISAEGKAPVRQEDDEDGYVVSPHCDQDFADLSPVPHCLGRASLIPTKGDPGLIPGEFKCLRRQGRFVVISSPRGPTPFDFHDLCNRPSYTIIGAHLASQPRCETPDNPWTSERESELFFRMIETGELDPGQLVTHRVSYRQAPETYEALLRDRSKAMGVLTSWT